jgi:hypothetical protein
MSAGTAEVILRMPGEQPQRITGIVDGLVHTDLGPKGQVLDLTVHVQEVGAPESASYKAAMEFHGTEGKEPTYRRHDPTRDHEFDVELPDQPN